MWRLHPSTLHPPALSADDDAAAEESLPWFLLELKAYVAKRDNATTAFSRTWDGKRIQVTLCPRRPPRVSYVCVHSPDAAEIHVEPRVVAVEDDLAVLSITVGPQKDVHKNLDYYVYQVDGGSGRPSLTHIPRPPRPYFPGVNDTGVLRYRTDGENTAAREYVIAALYSAPWGRPAGQFDLCLYDSKRGVWKVHVVSLSKRRRRRHGGKNFYHKNYKVVTIGGDAGTMAFVDLWRGIIFCDVLRVEEEEGSQLRYVAVPGPMRINKTLEDCGDPDARRYRDIAVVGGRLKYVDLQRLLKACGHKCYFSYGWKASTWSRPATSSSSDDGDCWRQDTKIMDSRVVNVDSKLVPKVWRDQGMALSPFMDLDACQPVLGLQEEDADVIYFTTKINRMDADAWVVAVDMRKRELLAVDAFAAQRYVGINFSYVHARICVQASDGILKRRGT